MQLLNGLGADFPLPVVLVQHITPTFHFGFVRWLDGVCALPVREARDGAVPQRGHVYVAPAERHLHVEGGRFRLDNAPPLKLQRPSGTLLFRSLARSYGERCIAALLTGMGDDGADGLLEIRRAGGYTFAEDGSTAVVYGMPAAAAELGAVCKLAPLGEIAPGIRSLVTGRGELH
jgi:two-component system chemotaxis response regulator CheB